MRDYTKVISNLKQTIKNGGSPSSIATLKKTLTLVIKKQKQKEQE